MRITYLLLKNFASIYTAMKRKVIEIDFSKSKNRVILFIGDNGTGKTSILSALHPFAYPGNMDVRNGDELILEHENGYKEIHIEDDGSLYKIKHFYKATNNGTTLKSFIEKDGTELNVNGNVTSFKEIIQMELGLDLDYLKLIRLGSNVTNFMDMKASERKNFTSDLLSEIDVYSQFFKKINQDNRMLKTLMKNVTDKIDRLKIIDEQDIIDIINNNEDILDDLKTERDNCNSEIGKINGSIETLIPEGIESFLFTLNMDVKEYKQLVDDIKSKRTKLSKLNLIFFGVIEENISRVLNDISTNQNQITMNTNMINFYFTQLNNYYTQKEDRENNLKYLSSELEYSKLNQMYLDLHKEKEELGSKYKTYVPKCSKEDILASLRLMQEIDKFISNILTFDHDAVCKTIEIALNNHSVESLVRREVMEIDAKIQKNNLELLRTGSVASKKDGIYVLFQPSECKVENCSYMQFYKDHTNSNESSPTKKLEQENEKLERQRNFWLSLTDINKNIDYILLVIKTNKVLIDKLPEKFFDIPNILKSIRDVIPFYDEDHITNYVTILEEYERYLEVKEQIKEVKKELGFIEKNSSSLVTMQKELAEIDTQIFDLNGKIDDLKDLNEQLTSKIEDLEQLKDEYEKYKEINNDIVEKTNDAKVLYESITSRKDTEIKVNQYLTSRKLFDDKLSKLNYKITSTENIINDNKFKLRDFRTLTEDKKILQEKFDDINIIKEALSTNKGIPLLFIQLYFKSTKLTINRLLNTIYHGDLEIDDFDINESEFKIPYFKNGIRISDVIRSSQGETSFISLALSFALLEQSIKKYNIMLLDEIDATLDHKNRAAFINILEQQLDSINAEQVFMITHNNMFDSYPVDLIITSDVKIDNYKNTNIIFSAVA